MEEAAATETTAEQPAIEAAAPEQAAVESPAIDTGGLLSIGEPQVNTESNESSFLEQFSEEYRNDPNIAKHKSVDSMAKSLINAQQMLGKKGIIKPGEDATEDQWNDYYTSIGRPAESNMYKYSPIEGAPDIPSEEMGAYQEFAHKNGYTQEQYQNGIEFQFQLAQQAEQTLQQERAQEAAQVKSELFQEWGEYDFEPNVAAANKAAEDLGMKEVLIDNGLVNNKEVIKALYNASKSLGSSKIIGEHKVSAGNFDDQLAALKSQPGYNDKMNPERASSIQSQIDDLYKRHYSTKR